MKLTKKAIEKKYGVRLERDEFDMSDSYKSWIAYVDTKEGEVQVAWQYTLIEMIDELDENKKEIEEIKKEDNYEL